MKLRSRKTVLHLSPYHCELNPIELVWAQIKNELAAKNRTFKLNELEQVLHNAIENVTAITWHKCINHVIKEFHMKDLDGIIDDVIEPFIIAIGDESNGDDSIFSETSD